MTLLIKTPYGDVYSESTPVSDSLSLSRITGYYRNGVCIIPMFLFPSGLFVRRSTPDNHFKQTEHS